MAVSNETVYIKANKNVEVTKREVTLGDMLTMECSNQDVVTRLKTIKLTHLSEKTDKRQQRYVVSILKIIECIHQVYPNIDVQNLGEIDIILTYENQTTPNIFWHVAKVICICLISFFGAAFSIMAFNNDVATANLFSQIYEQVVGQPSDGFTLLEVTYSIGLAIGILVFFNHVGRKRFTVDPTPMEVEMSLYEDEIQDTLIRRYSRRGKEIDVGNSDSTGNRRS